MKGKAATVSGTMDATVPTEVPMISRVSGIIITIRMINGTDRSRLISTFRKLITGAGRGRMPLDSPVTRITPSGRPITMAKKVASSVEYRVSHIANGNSFSRHSHASCSFSGVKALAKFISPPPPLHCTQLPPGP